MLTGAASDAVSPGDAAMQLIPVDCEGRDSHGAASSTCGHAKGLPAGSSKQAWVRAGGRARLLGMEGIDPAELDFGRLADAQGRASNPAWRAAGEHGIDLLLLERNLGLTPAERMAQLEDALCLMGRG